MQKLVVQLVAWKGSKYIEYLFDSLRKQSYQDWKLVILDNDSTDDTVEKIKKEIQNFPVEFELIEGKKNLGFAGGHNLLVESRTPRASVSSEKSKVESEYVLLLNQDMYLESDCLEKMVEFMDNNNDVAVVSPRLMKWEFDKIHFSHSNIQESFSNKIDSLGLKVLRNRRVIEKYTGKDWPLVSFRGGTTRNLSEETVSDKSQENLKSSNSDRKDSSLRSAPLGMNCEEVFGVSGAFPMFRKSVIDKVGLFDDLYYVYKEDVDLAYRLRIAGYKAFVLLDTVAYHDRSAEGLEKKGDGTAMDNKKKQSEWVRYHSYKNHLMTLYKNEYWQNCLLDLPWISWYELKKFIYFLLFDRRVLKGLGEIWKNRKDLKIKRLKIKELRKVGWRELRVWFK